VTSSAFSSGVRRSEGVTPSETRSEPSPTAPPLRKLREQSTYEVGGTSEAPREQSTYEVGGTSEAPQRRVTKRVKPQRGSHPLLADEMLRALLKELPPLFLGPPRGRLQGRERVLQQIRTHCSVPRNSARASNSSVGFGKVAQSCSRSVSDSYNLARTLRRTRCTSCSSGLASIWLIVSALFSPPWVLQLGATTTLTQGAQEGSISEGAGISEKDVLSCGHVKLGRLGTTSGLPLVRILSDAAA